MSCCTNIIQAVMEGKEKLRNMGSGKVDMIFIDFKAAYDTIDRNLLLRRLYE